MSNCWELGPRVRRHAAAIVAALALCAPLTGADAQYQPPGRASITTGSSVRSAALEQIRRQIVTEFAPARADQELPSIKVALATLSLRAKRYAQALTPGGQWSDLDYRSEAALNEHFSRLLAMAQVFTAAGGKGGQASDLFPAILRGLDMGVRLYAPDRCAYPVQKDPCGNWWFWEIGVPRLLGPTLALLEPDAPAAILAAGKATLRGHIGPAPQRTGANLSWSALNHAYSAILDADPVRLSNARDAMFRSVSVGGEEGVQPDFSFRQHGPQLYTGGYGKNLLEDASKFALWTQGTTYELSASALDGLADYAIEGAAWAVFSRHFDPSAIGREVTRPRHSAASVTAALLRLSQLPLRRRDEVASIARRQLASWPSWTDLGTAAAAARLTASDTSATELLGHRHYPYSDYTVHRGKGYFASVRMFSERTLSGELVNGEGKTQSRQADGRLYLALDGDAFYDRDVAPTLDWRRLPGISVELSPHVADGTFGRGTTRFVGGLSTGRNGVSAMESAPLGSSLTAKKSWFFFDQGLVCLTSDIQASSTYPIETVVEQRPLAPGQELYGVLVGDKQAARPLQGPDFSKALRWLHAGGMGYLFFGGEHVEVTHHAREGRWSDLGAGDSVQHTNSMLTIIIPHGIAPARVSAAYALRPNVTRPETEQWVASSPFILLQNDSRGAAVKERRTGDQGIVFFAEGTVAGVTSSDPAVVYVQDDGKLVRVYMADPAQGVGSATLTLPMRVRSVESSQGVTSAAAGSTTIVTFPRAGGKTQMAVFAHY